MAEAMACCGFGLTLRKSRSFAIIPVPVEHFDVICNVLGRRMRNTVTALPARGSAAAFYPIFTASVRHARPMSWGTDGACFVDVPRRANSGGGRDSVVPVGTRMM